jgi:hypothetical protein
MNRSHVFSSMGLDKMGVVCALSIPSLLVVSKRIHSIDFMDLVL